MSIDTERARLRVRIMAAITTVEDVRWLTQTAGAAEVKSSAEAAARRPRDTEAEARAWLDTHSPTPPEEDL